MNKLQKLFENGIPFKIEFSKEPEGFYWIVEYDDRWMPRSHFNEAIEAIWQAAKKHYPDAECFKEEK